MVYLFLVKNSIYIFIHSIFLFSTHTTTYTYKKLPVISFNKMVTFIFYCKLTT